MTFSTTHGNEITETFDLTPTFKLVSDLRVKHRAPTDRHISVRSVIRKINELTHDIGITYDGFEKSITLKGEPTVINDVIIMISVNDTEQKIFGPFIYYMIPNLIRVGRMVIYKKQDNCSIYLVHRSNRKG